MWLDGTRPMLFADQVVSVCQSFRPVAPFSFLQKYYFFNTERGVAI